VREKRENGRREKMEMGCWFECENEDHFKNFPLSKTLTYLDWSLKQQQLEHMRGEQGREGGGKEEGRRREGGGKEEGRRREGGGKGRGREGGGEGKGKGEGDAVDSFLKSSE
jgi:hypothetical protein